MRASFFLQRAESGEQRTDSQELFRVPGSEKFNVERLTLKGIQSIGFKVPEAGFFQIRNFSFVNLQVQTLHIIRDSSPQPYFS